MKTIGLIDFSHTLRVNYHVRAPDAGPTQAGEQTLAQLSDWRRGLDHVIVCLDSPPYDRAKVYPEYKAGRERDDGYIAVCKWTKQRLVADGYSIAASTGCEADDVIATLAYKRICPDVRIFGGDKDCLQSVVDEPDTGNTGYKVRCFARDRTGEWEIRDVDWVARRYGVLPEQIPLLLAICGDTSDNIPGIKGIGEKGAAKLITEFGTIAKMRLAAVKAHDESKLEGAKPLSKFWHNFLAGSPRLPEWLELTTLRTDVPLDVDALLVKQPIKPLAAEDIEHGDAWEPSEDELKEEQQTFTVDPSEVISGPKVAAAPGPKATQSSVQDSAVPSGEAKTEVPKARDAQRVEGSTTGYKANQSVDARPDSGSSAETGTSIVVDRPPAPNWALQLQPSTAKEALQIAAVLFNSRVCSQFGSERGVYAVISLGRELGLGMMASLQGFHIVSDKPFASSNLLRALAEKDPNCEWLICTHADDQSATWVTKHRKIAEPMSYTYTRERAEQNGMFTGKNAHNWKTKTQEMLEKTAGAKGSRRWYPASTLGLHIPEEIGDNE